MNSVALVLKRLSRTLLALLCVAISADYASAAEFICPANESLSAVQGGDELPAGWSLGFRAGPIRLTGASVFDGPPVELASLVPDHQTGKGAHTRATWKFEGEFPKGKWISCDYGEGLVYLAHKLEDSVIRCTATFDQEPKPPSLVIRFTCS